MTLPFSVTQNGKPLDSSKYIWDPKTKTFSTTENNLVIDASGRSSINFNTGSKCTFKTGYSCTFNTDDDCTFNTGYHCTFNTDHSCTFNTGSKCTFNTGDDCTFNTGSNCTFNTSSGCSFNTGSKCTFNTSEYCVCIRRDVFEVIQIPSNQEIKLNEYKVKGYKLIKPTHVINIDGKEITLSHEFYEELKKQLTS